MSALFRAVFGQHFKPVGNQGRVTGNVVPTVVVEGIAVDDARHLVRDHLQSFDLIGGQAVAVTAIE